MRDPMECTRPAGAADEKRGFLRAERLAMGENKRQPSASFVRGPSATELRSVAGPARLGGWRN